MYKWVKLQLYVKLQLPVTRLEEVLVKLHT